MKTYFVLFLVFLSTSSYACSCLYSEFGFKDYKHAKFVIDGRVTKVSVDKNKREKVITFKIKNAFKGSVDEFIELRTGLNSAECGLNLSRGDQWILFVSEFNNSYHVGLCGHHLRYNLKNGETNAEKRKKRKLKRKMLKQLREFKKSYDHEQ